MPVKVPATFNGELFMKKFGVGASDFSMYKGDLYCEKLSNLTESDIADCVDIEETSSDAVLAFVKKWGSITVYPQGNENQQFLYRTCQLLEQDELLTRSAQQMAGAVIYISK